MVRRTAIFLLVCAVSARADVIILKNGGKIFVDSARVNQGRVEYNIGDNLYAIPESSVLRIDTGAAPAVSGQPPLQQDESAPEPAPPDPEEVLATTEDLTALIIRNGQVSTDALDSVEAEGNKEKSAAAYFIAARHEASMGRFEPALRYLRRARSFAPDHPVLLSQEASLLLHMGRFSEAVPAAEEATRKAPRSGYAWAMLGFAYLQVDRAREAVHALKTSLDLQPDAGVKDLLARAQRELSAESDFVEESSSHFLLRYRGDRAPLLFRRQLLSLLEDDFTELSSDLDFTPRETISVVLYSNQQFFDVTQAPTWTGALYDGKLRLPISGLESVTPELARVLKHELTHSFINQLTRGRCPNWLNEGVAQLLEPRSSASDGSRLAMLYTSHRNIPLNELEGSFMRFSTLEAQVAYAQSLASVEYIRNTYGMNAVAAVLRRIGEGFSTESALRASIHSGYSQLEQELTEHLQRTYGQ